MNEYGEIVDRTENDPKIEDLEDVSTSSEEKEEKAEKEADKGKDKSPDLKKK